MADGTVIQRLGAYLAGVTYEDLPPDVVELAKTRVLNGLAVSFPGKDLPAAVVAWNMVKANSGACTLIGRSEKVPPLDAALANGVSGHTVLQEDVGSGGHPSPVIIPAALAAGEQVGASGREVITAIVMGYEAQGRIFRGFTQHNRRSGFRSVSQLGVFGAAAVGAKLLKLDASATTSALGFAANLAGGVYRGFAEGAMDPYYQAGLASRNGLTAAYIAQHGGVATPMVLEGAQGFYLAFTGSTEKVEDVVKGFGEGFDISSIQSKPYATSHGNHEPTDLAVSLAEQVDDVGRVRFAILRVPASTRATSGKDNLPPFHNYTMAQMSLRFCVASALMKRPVTSIDYFREHYDDREVWDLAYRIQVVGDEGRKVTALEVHLDDGRTLSLEEDRSYKWRPNTENLKTLFRDMAGKSLGQRTEAVIDSIMGLDELDDVRELTAGIAG